MKLYEIVESYQQILDLDLDKDQFAEVLESFNISLKEKAINIAKVKANKQSDIDSLDIEIKRLKARQNAIKKGVDKLEEYLLDAMVNTNTKKIESDLFTISLRKSERVIVEEGKVPTKFKKQQVVVTVDKKAIKKAIKNGESVKGASIEEHQNLQIK